MRYFLLAFVLAVVVVIGLAGFRGDISRRPPIEVFPDMDRQPKPRPQARSEFFADGRSSRLPVEGTVARGSAFVESPLSTGMEEGSTNFVAAIPMQVTAELMAKGAERYQIFCAPCHSPTGDGNGITKPFGMGVVANLHDARIIQMTDGEIYHVITQGRNLMMPYDAQLSIEERWAVVAYLRALQLARLGAPDELPEAQRAPFVN